MPILLGVCITFYAKLPTNNIIDFPLSTSDKQPNDFNNLKNNNLESTSLAASDPWWVVSEDEFRLPSEWDRGSSPSTSTTHPFIINEHTPMYNWTAVTICLFSRWPFVRELQCCLQSVYNNSLIDDLITWENEIFAEKSNSETANSLQSSARLSNNALSPLSLLSPRAVRLSLGFTPRRFEPLSLASQCSSVFTMLAFESPAPKSGLFSVTIRLPETPGPDHGLAPTLPPGFSSSHRLPPGEIESFTTDASFITGTNNINTGNDTNVREDDPMENNVDDGDGLINFTLPSPEDLPVCPYSLTTALFHRLGRRGALTVLGAALKETRILLFSADLAVLPAVCEAIRVLLYPLKWPHVYLPIVPLTLLEIVEAPTSYILGIHSDWLPLLSNSQEGFSHTLFVDCDTGAIDVGAGGDLSTLVLRFPPRVDRWLMTALREVLSDAERVFGDTPKPNFTKVSYPSSSLACDVAIQLLIFDTMLNLLRFIPGCIFTLGENTEVFHRPLFLTECPLPDELPFYTMLTNTQLFGRFTESLNISPSMDFFHRARARLPPLPLNHKRSIYFPSTEYFMKDMLPTDIRYVVATANSSSLYRDVVDDDENIIQGNNDNNNKTTVECDSDGYFVTYEGYPFVLERPKKEIPTSRNIDCRQGGYGYPLIKKVIARIIDFYEPLLLCTRHSEGGTTPQLCGLLNGPFHDLKLVVRTHRSFSGITDASNFGGDKLTISQDFQDNHLDGIRPTTVSESQHVYPSSTRSDTFGIHAKKSFSHPESQLSSRSGKSGKSDFNKLMSPRRRSTKDHGNASNLSIIVSGVDILSDIRGRQVLNLDSFLSTIVLHSSSFESFSQFLSSTSNHTALFHTMHLLYLILAHHLVPRPHTKSPNLSPYPTPPNPLTLLPLIPSPTSYYP